MDLVTLGVLVRTKLKFYPRRHFLQILFLIRASPVLISSPVWTLTVLKRTLAPNHWKPYISACLPSYGAATHRHHRQWNRHSYVLYTSIILYKLLFSQAPYNTSLTTGWKCFGEKASEFGSYIYTILHHTTANIYVGFAFNVYCHNNVTALRCFHYMRCFGIRYLTTDARSNTTVVGTSGSLGDIYIH